MTCVKEKGGGHTDEDTRILTRNWVQEKDQDGFLEISFGVTFWLTAQARRITFLNLQQELPFAQSERRANSSTSPHISQVSPILAYEYPALC